MKNKERILNTIREHQQSIKVDGCVINYLDDSNFSLVAENIMFFLTEELECYFSGEAKNSRRYSKNNAECDEFATALKHQIRQEIYERLQSQISDILSNGHVF